MARKHKKLFASDVTPEKRRPTILFVDNQTTARCEECHSKLVPDADNPDFMTCAYCNTEYRTDDVLEEAEVIGANDEGSPILVSGGQSSRRKTRLEAHIERTIDEMERRGYQDIEYTIHYPE